MTAHILCGVKMLKQLREKRKPLIIDADGLYITTKNLELIRGYDLAVLTPNKNEFQRLADQLEVPLEGPGAPEDPVMEIARLLEGPLLVRKGKEDVICDGRHSIRQGEAGSKRRAGGQVRCQCQLL